LKYCQITSKWGNKLHIFWCAGKLLGCSRNLYFKKPGVYSRS